MTDDHSIMLVGLRKLVENAYEVVGTVEEGCPLVEAAGSLKPDVMLLDISTPLLNGLDAAREIRMSAPDSTLLFLTMHASPTYMTLKH